MHGIRYIWKAPVSIDSCLTIEGLLKKCIGEEVSCSFFLRTVIVNRGNSCELKPKKNVLVLRQWADLFQFSKFRNIQTQNNVLKFLLLLANVFPLLLFLKHLIYLSSFLVIHFLFLISKNVRLHHFSEVEKYWLQLHRFKNTE